MAFRIFLSIAAIGLAILGLFWLLLVTASDSSLLIGMTLPILASPFILIGCVGMMFTGGRK